MFRFVRMLNIREVTYNRAAMQQDEIAIAIVSSEEKQFLPIEDTRFCTYRIGLNNNENLLVYQELIDFLMNRSGDKRRYIMNVFYDPQLEIAETLSKYFRRALSLTPEKIVSDSPLEGDDEELGISLWKYTRDFMLSGII